MKRQRWTDRGRFVGGDDAETMPSGPDRVYVNLACINSSAAPTASNGLGPPVVFTETRTANIINKADDYAMSIMRWSSTGVQLPAFVPALLPTATDPDETAYEIGIVALSAAPTPDPVIPDIIEGVSVNEDGSLTIYNNVAGFSPDFYAVNSLVNLSVGALGSLGVDTFALSGLYTVTTITADKAYAVTLTRAGGEPVTGPYPSTPFVAGGSEHALTGIGPVSPSGVTQPWYWAIVQAASTSSPPTRTTTLSFAPSFEPVLSALTGTGAVFRGGAPAPVDGAYVTTTSDADVAFPTFANGPESVAAAYDSYSCTVTGGRVVSTRQIIFNLASVPRDFAANTLVGVTGVSARGNTLETKLWRFFGHAPGTDQYVFDLVANGGVGIDADQDVEPDGTVPPTLWANVASGMTAYLLPSISDAFLINVASDPDVVYPGAGSPISTQNRADGGSAVNPPQFAGTWTMNKDNGDGSTSAVVSAAQFFAMTDPLNEYVGGGVVLLGDAATATPYGSTLTPGDLPGYRYAFNSRVYWQPQFESEVAPKSPAANGGDIDFNELSRYYWATDEQHACNVINTALAKCWTAMIMTASATGIPITDTVDAYAIASASLDKKFATFSVTPAVAKAVVGSRVVISDTGLADWDGTATFLAFAGDTFTVVLQYDVAPSSSPPSSGKLSFPTTSPTSTPTFVATGGGGLRLLLPAKAYKDALAPDGSPGFAIQMNAALYELFKGFASTSTSTPNAQLQPIVTVGAYSSSLWAPREVVYTFDMLNAMQLEAQLPSEPTAKTVVGLDATFPCTDTWSPIAAMLIDTQLPIIPEEQSAPTFASVAFAPSATRDSTSSMTDISLDLSTGCTDWLQKINYTPSAQYRWTTLTGTGPIQNMTFQLYWRARFNNQRYVATLSPGGSVEVKLLFQRR